MIISHVVAVAKNNVIGNDNDIPWKIPGEQQRFKALTMDKYVVMGRKTYESLGKELKGRKVIIVSRRENQLNKKHVTVPSIEEALEVCCNEEEVFIAGGGEIYKSTIEMAHKLYVTEIDAEIKGNVYYPEIDDTKYEKTYSEQIENANIPYTYMTYERK